MNGSGRIELSCGPPTDSPGGARHGVAFAVSHSQTVLRKRGGRIWAMTGLDPAARYIRAPAAALPYLCMYTTAEFSDQAGRGAEWRPARPAFAGGARCRQHRGIHEL